MSGHKETQGHFGIARKKFIKNLNAGEKLMGSEFVMTVEGYPDLEVLIRTASLPAMGRADVEDFGQGGLKFNQYGPLENSGEITVTCAETIHGNVLNAIKDIVFNKTYVNIRIAATPESLADKEVEALSRDLLHCKIRSDVVELSTEDTSSIVKPSLTIVYNWVE